MSSTRRIFYVVGLPEGEFRTCLDAMRVIVRPQTRFSSHITVRGPYPEPADVGIHSDRIRNVIVRVVGVGTFYGDRQNTVFLHCSCPDLLTVWDKRDYGYNPHITLYDGESRAFAESLDQVVGRHSLRYSFRAGGLEPLVSIKGAVPEPLRDRLDVAVLAGIFGDWPSDAELDTMDEAQRLDWVSRIARHLSCTDRVAVLA